MSTVVVGQGQIDSLSGVWKDKSLPESERLNALSLLVGQLLFVDVDSSMQLADVLIEHAKEAGDKRNEAFGERNKGNGYYFIGDYPHALEHYQRSLKLYLEIDNLSGAASTYNSVGMIYSLMGNTQDGIKNANIGLNMAIEIGDTNTMSKVYNSLGIYYESINLDSALSFHQNSLELKLILGDVIGTGNSYANIGSVYYKKKEIQKSIEYREKARDVFERVGASNRLAGIYGYLGESYAMAGRYDEAITTCEDGQEISKQVQSLAYEAQNCNCLYMSYKAKGDYKKALEFYELSAKLVDSVNNAEAKADILHQKYEFEYERKAAIDSVKAADAQLKHNLEIQAEKEKTQRLRWQSTALFIGIGLALLVLVVIINRLNVTRKQKKVIEQQKQEVEMQKELIQEKNTEITSSIQYAQRIQEAILPSDSKINDALPENFVLYLPKDIVAGDFYWLESTNNKVIFAVADCTGHGVPGAMVSVVCHNALNRCVREFGLSKPNEILDKCRELVVASFESKKHDVKDGMDISICALRRDTLTLEYAGANNDLYVLQNGMLNEVHADRQPVGKYRGAKPFQSHQIQLNKGDHIYLFTDGFADQFGGEKGKKFKYKHFKDLLLQTSASNLSDQKLKIQQVFEDWRGDIEQIDDVCIIGVRL